MKKKLFLFLTSVIASLTIASCGKGSSKASITDKLTEDTTDYSALVDKETELIRFHYKRLDNDDGTYQTYLNWGLWAWDSGNSKAGYRYDVTMYDSYGGICDVPLNVVNPDEKVTTLGFIVAKFGGTSYTSPTWYGKDIDNDRFVEVDPISKGGIQHVYLLSGDAKIFLNPNDASSSTFSYARITSTKSLIFFITKRGSSFKLNSKNLEVYINGVRTEQYSFKNNSTDKLVSGEINFDNEFNLYDTIELKYKFSKDFTDSTKAIVTTYYDTDEFKNKFTYVGDDLGVTFDNLDMPTKTTFKVWAPTSKSVKLNIYSSGDYINDLTPLHSFEMKLQDKGVFTYTYNGDLTNKYYTYTVTNSVGINEVVDPYAKSAGLNGRRGMIVNFKKINNSLEGWNEDTRFNYGENGTDASIYEIHVRDMTINPNSGVKEENRGKFLGLAEENTKYEENGITVSTSLAHLKELGITHVQIQPFYDYSSVDESLPNTTMSETNYNWGYDPLNYNVLEGSYATDPNDGTVRIKEFKQMVMALHKANINITMDVVYNHTASTESSNFELLVPNYYHRTKYNGSFYNGSGCGNEMASERAMVRQFIVQSCAFWTEEYHLSGFRFDLMGLIDNQTMIDVYKTVHDIDDKALVYGEPWTGGTTSLAGTNDEQKLSNQQTLQSSLAQSYFAGNKNYVGAFNDIIRNGLRGDNSPTSGWIQSGGTASSGILDGIKGMFRNRESTIEPEQVLNYVSCHDNYTLYDQLALTSSNNEKAYTQAESVIFTSQGVAFMQEGEDFKRSKDYVDSTGKATYSHNSYNVGDYINDMDYSLKVKNLETFNYFKKMIQVRKDNPELTLSSRSEITSRVSATSEGNSIVITIKGLDGEGDLLIVHSTGSYQKVLEGSYTVLLSNSGLSGTVSSLSLSRNESIILRKI